MRNRPLTQSEVEMYLEGYEQGIDHTLRAYTKFNEIMEDGLRKSMEETLQALKLRLKNTGLEGK